MKNPNGYGAVIYLGKNRRKPWAVRVTDKIIDGKQTYRYISYHATKKEAVKALAKEQIQPTSPKANITFSEIYEEWKLTPAFTAISKQTQDNYTAAYSHLKTLHGAKFTDVRTGNMQTIIDNLRTAPDKEGNTKALSKSTKEKVKLLCGLLYKYAMQNDICNKNYAEFIKIAKEEKKEKEVFTDIEIKKIEQCNLPYADTVLILIYTGLRISELLQLTKFNVDLKNSTIIGGLKTDAGKDRIVPIHLKAFPLIKKWYSKATDTLIFKGENEPITPNYYRKYIYYPLLEQLEIDQKTPHATRHTCATLLAKAGADTNAIKMILGHTDYAFTADTYTHTDVEFLKTELSKI